MNQPERLRLLIDSLIAERELAVDGSIATTLDESKSLFRALANTRPPMPAADGLLALQDDYLKAEIADAGITELSDYLRYDNTFEEKPHLKNVRAY